MLNRRRSAKLTALPRTHREQSSFIWVYVAFGVFACLYIWRLSFVIDGVRYFTLADDQMISMRYAENLANGHGLVWNPGGPRIEGYTNFAWMLYMALFHLLPIPRPVISVCIQLTGAMLLLANLTFVRKIALEISGGLESVAIVALLLTAFYIPLDNWAFQGTEVSVLTLMMTAAAWLTLRVVRGETPFALYVLLGATTLVRPDMVVLAAAVLIGLTVAEPGKWRDYLLGGGTIVAIFLISETVFRLCYFGDVLPNTYYLKMTGFPIPQRVSRGLLMAAALSLQLLPLVLMIIKQWAVLRRNSDVIMLVWLFGAQIAYSIFAGGDGWEWWGGSNRFIAIAMPLFFLVVACAVVQLIPKGVDRRVLATIIGLIVAVNLLAWSPFKPVQRLLMIEPPLENLSDQANVRAALDLRFFTTSDCVVAVIWAGAVPYFSERPAIDLLGKMDPRIAHEPMHQSPGSNWTTFYPGHLKWDYQYSIDGFKPDVIQAPLWRLSYELDTPDEYLKDYDLRQLGRSQWYVRRGTDRVR